jgi:hypothetical protein
VKRLLTAVAALVAVGGLAACTSQPSAKAVAKDVVQSLNLPEDQVNCMLGIIDKMSSDEIDKLGADNINATITSSGGGTPAMQAFIDKLQTCEPAKG